VTIHRKWRGYWYQFEQLEEFSEFSTLMNLSYEWIKNDSQLYKREDGIGTKEMLIFSKGSPNPVMLFKIKAFFLGFKTKAGETFNRFLNHKDMSDSYRLKDFKRSTAKAKKAHKPLFKLPSMERPVVRMS
jgi:hypothetical protein